MKKEKDIDKEPIYGHYHCKKCKCSMRPLKRLPWRADRGVGHIHYCPKCKRIFIEYEY